MIVLSSCTSKSGRKVRQIKNNELKTPPTYTIKMTNGETSEFRGVKVVVGGMTYMHYTSNEPYSSRNITIVNLTKDSLEVKLLKNQLNNFK
jgi:hypothetical protein